MDLINKIIDLLFSVLFVFMNIKITVIHLICVSFFVTFIYIFESKCEAKEKEQKWEYEFDYDNDYEGEVKIFDISGNIGVGKSEIISKLKQLTENRNDFIIVDEPVDIWEKTYVNGKNILEAFYENKENMAFTFQMFVMDTIYQRLLEIRSQAKEKSKKLGKPVIVIMERTLLSSYNVFAKMLYNEKYINGYEWICYTQYYNRIVNNIEINGYIYIRTDPKTCFNRIKTRGRPGEDNITLTYLRKCDMYHETFYNLIKNKYRCVIIPNEKCKMSPEYQNEIENIMNFLEE